MNEHKSVLQLFCCNFSYFRTKNTERRKPWLNHLNWAWLFLIIRTWRNRGKTKNMFVHAISARKNSSVQLKELKFAKNVAKSIRNSSCDAFRWMCHTNLNTCGTIFIWNCIVFKKWNPLGMVIWSRGFRYANIYDAIVTSLRQCDSLKIEVANRATLL